MSTDERSGFARALRALGALGAISGPPCLLSELAEGAAGGAGELGRGVGQCHHAAERGGGGGRLALAQTQQGERQAGAGADVAQLARAVVEVEQRLVHGGGGVELTAALGRLRLAPLRGGAHATHRRRLIEPRELIAEALLEEVQTALQAPGVIDTT